jgi:Zn-dependent protease with chaperone function
MDFFEYQERARRNTLILVFMFFLAVVLIIFAVYAVIVFAFSIEPSKTSNAVTIGQIRFWNPDLFLWTAIGTLFVIITGTFYKIRLLSAGGSAVAGILGAELINPETIEPAERRLLNVVEEMAISSGLPVPAVYVLEEQCINAFAAGFTPRDAIIGVTRGCMNLLTRDELQSVIGHEFSHILNGDMRLNLRLMGILHGILVISMIGYWIFRISTQSTSSRRKGGGVIVIVLLGLCLMIIGYIGVFFARIIKSAVSRQREFLADAASVQFTRNSEAMAGALKKIGGLMLGARIVHPNAEVASHLFFADGLKQPLFNLMSTHPPLTERIRRLDPSFDGTFPEISTVPSAYEDVSAENVIRQNFAAAPATIRTGERKILVDVSQAVKQVGRTDADYLHGISQWLGRLPPQIRFASRDALDARALIMSILIARDPATRKIQVEYIRNNVDPSISSKINGFLPLLENMPEAWFLPITDLALSGIKILPRNELIAFSSQLRQLIEADATITLSEYVLQSMVQAQIKSWTGQIKVFLFSSSNIQRFLNSMTVILSTLAYYGKVHANKASAMFQQTASKLFPQQGLEILPPDKCGLQQVDAALTDLTSAAPKLKKRFLEACSAAIADDGRITLNEAQLLRAVAARLDCPTPPVLPSIQEA